MLKKILLGVLLVGILTFGGLTYYVSNLDWNTYKDTISEKFFEITGKKVEFGGRLNVSLLPQPVMVAENISVYNPENTQKALATIEKLETSVSLSSLLQKAPEVHSLSISGAKVWIEKNENGNYNWTYGENENPSDVAKQTNLHSVSLQNADFYYEDKSADINFKLEKVNAEIQASAYDGPYRLDGNFSKDNEHYAIAVGIGSLSSIDGIDLNFSISHPASESFFRLDGMYNNQEHNIKGDFSGGSKKTAQIVNILAQEKLMNEETQKELQFSSGVEMDKTAVKLSSFVTKYAEDIEGSGSVNYPLVVTENEKRQIDVKYEFLNVDLRHFYPAIIAQYEKFKNNNSEYIPDTNFNINADLAAKHVDFSDNDAGFLENVTLKADWTDNILTIEEFFASAIGDTSISVSGDLREEDAKPHYFLKNSIISTEFLNFLNALDAGLKSHVQSSYRNAGLDFSIVGDDSGFSIENGEFSMDKMKINADISTVFSEEKPEIKIQAKADSFNIDNYIPNDTEERDFWEQLSTDVKKLDTLKNVLFDIDFAAANVIFRSTPIEDFIIKISNIDGNLNIKELSMQNVAGATIAVSGIIEPTEENIEFKDIQTDITATNISELISQTNFVVPDWKLFKTKNFVMSALIEGNLAELNTQIKSDIDSLNLSYEGTIRAIETTPDFSGYLVLKTTNMGTLFDGLNIDAKNIPNRNGALNCEGQIAYSDSSFAYYEAKCMLGSSEYIGNIEITQNDKSYNIKSKLEADEFNLAYLFDFTKSKVANFGSESPYETSFISRPDLSRDSLDLSKYSDLNLEIEVTAKKALLRKLSFDNMHFKLSNKDNTLKIEDIITDYKNAAYTGDITVFYANPDNPETKGNIKFENLDIGLVGGNVYMFNNGKITGNTSFESKGANAYDLFTNISGYITMNVENLNFKGFNLSAIQKDIAKRKYSKGLFQVVRDNLQRGETEFDTFDITIAMKNGTLTVANLNLDNSVAKSNLNFEIDLKDWKINSKMTIFLNDVGDVPSFDVSLSGMLQKPSLEINIEDMVKNYDEHWKQIEEQEQAQKEAERRELNTKMEAEQTKVESLSALVNSYAPVIEKYKEKSKKDENIVWYTNKLAEISLINNDIDSMKALSHTPDFSDADVAKIKDKTENYNNLIKTWDDEIAKRYAEDVDDRLSKVINAKSNNDINLQKLKDDCEKILKEKTADLTPIKKQSELLENADFQRLKTEFYTACDNVSNKSTELDNIILPLNTVTDVTQKETSVINAENITQAINTMYSEAEVLQKNLIDFIQTLSSDIIKKHKEAEEKAKATTEEENGNNNNEIIISQEVTGADTSTLDVTVGNIKKPLLKKISETDNMVENLSDTQETETKPKGILIKGYEQKAQQTENKTPSKQNLLKEVDGAVKKASGTITVK